MSDWDFDETILGEPASSKNQRRFVRIKGVPRLIPSEKAAAYSDEFRIQCSKLAEQLEGPIALRLDVYYASRRPDLAAMELVKDLLQGFIYDNDKHVKAQVEYWNLDRENPRVRIRARTITPRDESKLDDFKGTTDLDYDEVWGS